VKYIIAALVALAAGAGFYAGWRFRGDPGVQVVTQTQVEERERVVTKVVKVTETAKKPDGAVVEKVTETTTSDKAVANTVAKPVADVSPSRPNYSISAYLDARSLGAKPEFRGVEFGRRVVGPLWITLGADVERNVTVGVRTEF